MFKNPRFRQMKPLLLFFLIYTVLFVLFAKTFAYTVPFVCGLLLAALVQPLICLMRRRLRVPAGLASLLGTLLVFVVIFGLLFLLGYYVVREIGNLVVWISSLTSDQVNGWLQPVYALMDKVNGYVKQLDASFAGSSGSNLASLVKSGLGMLGSSLTSLLGALTQIPTIFMMLLVTVLSTYFFSKDMGAMKEHCKRILGVVQTGSLRKVGQNSKTMGWRFIGSYMLIYGITFVESLIVFTLLGVPYPLVFAIITGIADVIPVLGPGTVYIPMAVVYLLLNNWTVAVILLVCWGVITAVRQIIEPKIVAKSINIHPLAMLAAIYFALVAKNFAVLLYFAILFILYEVLVQTEYLPSLLSALEAPSTKQPKQDAAD